MHVVLSIYIYIDKYIFAVSTPPALAASSRMAAQEQRVTIDVTCTISMCGVRWFAKLELVKTVAEQSYIKLVPWDTTFVRRFAQVLSTSRSVVGAELV